MEYDIIQYFGTAIDFAKFVNTAMELGWTPQGGVYCVMDNGAIAGYIQAMVRTPVQQCIHYTHDPALRIPVEVAP